MRVDETAVEVDRLLVVFGSIRKLTEDKVELGTVVVDIWVVLVVSNCELKIIRCRFLVSCVLLAKVISQRNKEARRKRDRESHT